MTRLAFIFILCTFVLHGENLTGDSSWSQPWRVSLIFLNSTSTLDTLSSLNYPEANPLLRAKNGNFTYQSALRKTSVTLAATLIQYLITRKHPKLKKIFTIINLGESSMFVTTSIRNFRLD